MSIAPRRKVQTKTPGSNPGVCRFAVDHEGVAAQSVIVVEAALARLVIARPSSWGPGVAPPHRVGSSHRRHRRRSRRRADAEAATAAGEIGPPVAHRAAIAAARAGRAAITAATATAAATTTAATAR